MNKNYPMEWVNQIQHTQPAGLCGAPTVGQVNLTAPIHQKSKMATPCGQAGGFIDLKERSGIAPGVSKNSVQLSVNVKTIVQPSEDGPASFAALDQKKILSELLARSRQCQPVSPTTVLPAPTLGSSEKFSVAKKVAEVQQTQPSKTFIEGPPLPLFDKSEEFGVELRKDGSKTFDLGPELHKPQLASKYSQGEIKYTTKGALNQMVQDLSRLKHGVTGCIIEETLLIAMEDDSDDNHDICNRVGDSKSGTHMSKSALSRKRKKIEDPESYSLYLERQKARAKQRREELKRELQKKKGNEQAKAKKAHQNELQRLRQKRCTGTPTLADGTTALANGSPSLPRSTPSLPRSTPTPDGTDELTGDVRNCGSDREFQSSNGPEDIDSNLTPDGPTILPEGIPTLADGTTLLADGSPSLPKSTPSLPKSPPTPDGTDELTGEVRNCGSDREFQSSNGPEDIDPNLTPDGPTILPEGTPTLADGTTTPDRTELSDNCNVSKCGSGREFQSRFKSGDYVLVEHGKCVYPAVTCDPLLNMYTEGIHFVADECLGKGSYGTVDLCYDSKTKKRFVRKQLPKTLLRTSEIIVPTTLNHHNVTKFYGLIQRENEGEGNPNMELLMEYAGFSLNKYILGEKRFTPEQIWDLAKQGLEALAHISRYSIVHLDVKPENICVIMMRGSLTLKLTDFGSSKLPHEPLKFVGLTPEYMAPEICKMFLQTQNPELNWGLTEDDITGKVDLFAFALVLMYLYKGYHILVKVINKGNTTYDGVDMQTRRLLHIQLMTLGSQDEQVNLSSQQNRAWSDGTDVQAGLALCWWQSPSRFTASMQRVKELADDSSGSSFVQSLIPDECDLEMRQLLRKLTEHQHQDRFSAREGLAFIEVKQKNTRIAVRQETKVKDATQQHVEKQIPVMAIDTGCEMDIPGIAEDCMESDNGPVKNRTKDALRMKLQPYGKSGKKGKNSKNLSSKTISARASVSEMHELCQGIASKQMPMTPVLEFRDLSLGQAVPGNAFQTDNRSTTVHQRKTDRNGPVAQPSMDTTPTYAQAAPAFGFSGLNPTQQVPGISCVNPFMRVEPENNIVSLGGNGIRPVATPVMNVPNNGAKVMRLEIPQELIQRWLQKKAEQAQVKTESTVHPGVINISDQIPQLARREQVKVEQAESLKKMEEDDVGNLPNFAQFF